MIPLMDSTSQKEARVLWSFWLACGLAVTGGIAPLLLAAGGANRVAVAVIPFGVGAAAMAVDALIYDRGKPVATLLYFVASIALVYGMLSMIAVVAEPSPPRPARKPRVKRTPVLHVEPPPTEERLELAAPEEVLELPASGTPDEPPEDAPTSS